MSDRSWESYPENVVVDTPLGQIQLAITDANHISIETLKGCVTTVRGKELRAHLHVNDYGKGNGFEVSIAENGMTYRSLYATKVGQLGVDATEAQRNAIIAAWVPAVNKFMSEHPELREAGKTANQNNAAMRIEHEIEELEKKITAKRAELKAVLRG